ncbi:MAG: thiamine pyrophosphate-binding protein [Chloroflexi bacterium]|nr:thiamine pyrophosphate-binding protein [Chloroflexota bacterium]
MADSTVGAAFAETLKRGGVPCVFGIPGGGSAIDLIEACRAVEIPFVLVQHETTAAMSAIVAGELTGSCGVCMSIMGPGAANLVGGASFGLWERHAVLSLTEAYPTAQAPRMSLQLMDHSKLFMSFSKASEVLNADRPAEQTERLMKLALSERPGPVHLDIPNNLLAQQTGPELSSDSGVQGDASEAVGDLGAVVDAIDNAAKPVLVVGPAVVRSDACNELRLLAERLGAAVVTSSKARGVISEDHPLSAGIVTGVYGDTTFEGRIIGQSDLIVAVGLDRMELLSPWNYPQPLVCIDAIDTSSEQVGSPAHTVYGPIKRILAQLTDAVMPSEAWSIAELSDFHDYVRSSLLADSHELNSTTLLERAQSLAPPDTTLVTETGIYNAVNLFTWRVRAPDLYFGSSGANTMGFSIPAALASALIRPKQKTVALVGDGGFLMKASELETLAREKLAPIIIVFNDRSLGLIRIKQAAKGYRRDAVDLAPVDFARLAQSFGGRGERVGTLASFDAAFKAALEDDRFTVIDARLDPDVYASHMAPIRG